VTGFDIAT
jgi:ribosome assembly protein 1